MQDFLQQVKQALTDKMCFKFSQSYTSKEMEESYIAKWKFWSDGDSVKQIWSNLPTILLCLSGKQWAVVSDERLLCVCQWHQVCSQPAGLRPFLH